MLSRDGCAALIHDETLNATTDGRGRVCDHTPRPELQRLDAGAWFHARFKGEAVPTLAQAAALCRVLGLAANVDIKPAAGTDAENRARRGGGLRRAVGRARCRRCCPPFQRRPDGGALRRAPSAARPAVRRSARRLAGSTCAAWTAAPWHCNARHLRDETLAAARAPAACRCCATRSMIRPRRRTCWLAAWRAYSPIGWT